MGTRERRERSDSADRDLSHLFFQAEKNYPKMSGLTALVAVGGFGRGELSPGSDLDIVLLHDGSAGAVSLTEFVNALLYPLWNGNRAIDHSVRTRLQTRETAQSDIRVATGLLDIRFISGRKDLCEAVAIEAKEDWQKNYKRNWPLILSSITERAEKFGELAFLLEPDLKESRGGLRDIHALRAISQIGAVPVALDRLASAEALLANARDALHQSSGRNRDQLLFAEQDKVAAILGFSDADELMSEVAKAARAVDYVMDLTIHRIENNKKNSWFKKKRSESIGRGLLVENEEVTIAPSEIDVKDFGLGLRAAAAAVQRGLPLSIDACIYLAEHFSEIPAPWPRQCREDLVALLGAGDSTIRVWEALDQEGLIEKWIPEWSHVRFLPQRNVLHRHTVDRHMLETSVRATHLIRRVHRPDLLLVAAAFHDVGKGFLDLDHSEYGEKLMASLARRIGFPEEDCQTLGLLVRQHLLLSAVATRRDLDDPQTISFVVDLVKDPETLELLHALSIADGEATGRAAWSEWKAKLVADLVKRTLASMSGFEPAQQLELSAEQLKKCEDGVLSIEISTHQNNFEIELIVPDQVGLLSIVAGVLTISRMDVRSARTRSHGNSAVMKWIVALDAHAEPPTAEALRTTLVKALQGEIDLTTRIDDRIRLYKKYPGIPVAPPVVSASNDIATDATVLEVRMHDRPGVLFAVSKAVTRFGVDIRAAIVATLGAEAFDTLYLTEASGGALSEERAVLLASQVEKLLLTQ